MRQVTLTSGSTMLVICLLVGMMVNCGSNALPVKASCQWSSHPEEGFVENWLCISPQYHVDGAVHKLDGGNEWFAFKGGAYCDDGGGFITRQAAMACIQKEGITK